MSVLVYSLSVYVVAFGIQIALWRIRLPRNQTAMILLIFFGTYAIALALSLLEGFPGHLMPTIDRAHFTMFYLPATLTYASLYSLVEHDSPSLAMVAAAAETPSGCNRADFVRAIDGERILGDRLQAAVGNGLVEQGEGTWRLTAAGRVVASVFAVAVRLLRSEKAG
jgi:hypothetical protein